MRGLWLAAGCICFVLGWVGLATPGVPGIVFFIGATVCFARSNPTWERWLRDHAHIGPPINDWLERRAISRKAKYSAIAMMAVSAGLSLWLFAMPLALVSAGAMAAVSWWIWTRAE